MSCCWPRPVHVAALRLTAALGLFSAVPGCVAPRTDAAPRRPVAIGMAPLPDGLLNEATAAMRRLETWRGVHFTEDVRLRVVAADGEGREGWYDAGRDELVLVAGRPATFRALTLVHELCHALQDQHLDLGQRGPTGSGPDAERAWRALVEGEATLAAAELGGLDLHGHHQGLAGAGDDAAQDTLFTTLQGARYVAALRDRGGWAAVEARWADPPTTAVEILRPGLGAAVSAAEQLGGGVAAGGVGPGPWLDTGAADRSGALVSAIQSRSLAPRVEAGEPLDAQTVVRGSP